MLAGARLQVDTGPPRLAQGVGSSAHHAWQMIPSSSPIGRTSWPPSAIVIDRLRQTARKPRRKLLEGHDLYAPGRPPSAAPASSAGYGR